MALCGYTRSMKVKTRAIAYGLAVCLFTQTTVGGPLEDATAAADRGDFATALRLIKPLADQGDAKAQFHLGTMYENGQSVPQDYGASVKWYRKAADQGDAAAQSNLGLMYGAGKGVPRNFVLAYMWCNLASASYSADETKMRDHAVEFRNAIATKMTPDQIALAQRLAREWITAHLKK